MQGHPRQQCQSTGKGDVQLQRLPNERQPPALERAESDADLAGHLCKSGLIPAIDPDADRVTVFDP